MSPPSVSTNGDGTSASTLNGELVIELPTLSKLSSVHSLIPIFDSESAVTPNYFLDSFDRLAESLNASNSEKLLIIKTRIRGSALSHIINSSELANETDYLEFKKKFLNFFETKSSLAFRSQQFSNCKMLPGESIKIFASRVSNATLKFLGKVNTKDAEIAKIIESTKIGKFLDGVKPEIKKSLLSKDVQTFDKMVEFGELLELNDAMSQTNNETIQAINSQPDYSEIISKHAQHTHEMISNLTRELNELKVVNQNAGNITQRDNMVRDLSANRISNGQRERFGRDEWRGGNNWQRQNNMYCTWCHKNNHKTENCYFRLGATESTRNSQFFRGRPQNRGNFQQSQSWRDNQSDNRQAPSSQYDRRSMANPRFENYRNRSPGPSRYNGNQRTPERNVRFSENSQGTRF